MSPAIQYAPSEGINLILGQTDITGLTQAGGPIEILGQNPGQPLLIHSIFGTVNLKNAGIADAYIDTIFFVDNEGNGFAALGPQWIPAGKTISVNFGFVVDIYAGDLGDAINAIIKSDIANMTVVDGSIVSVTGGPF